MGHDCEHEEEFGQLQVLIPYIKQTLDRIETQTTLTNGRIRKLELFRYLMTTCIGVAIGTIAFMLYAHQAGWVEAIINYGSGA